MNSADIFRNRILKLAAFMSLLMVCSCMDRFIFEGEGDCGSYYSIRFRYDHNMKFADAFSNEVNSIALFVFDDKGILTEGAKVSDKDALSSDTFEIPLELEEGHYDLVAWGGLMNEESFDLLSDIKVGETTIEELKVRMNRKYDDESEAVITEDLLPLFHGMMPLDVSSVPGKYTETMSLVKNTNVIRIVLQELTSNKVDADKFIFEITASNGLYDWDNSLLDDEQLTYSPWSLSTGTADMEMSKATASVSVAVAEFTIGRMMVGQSPVLTVRNKETGAKVLSIPVADYALLVKGNYNKDMNDQEYLDRQDEYNMTFFLDGGEWLSTSVIINSWRVVINNTELGN